VRPKARLVGLSFLMLFTELTAIRWTGAYIAYLTYFTNFVLLASFLGIGVGFVRRRGSTSLFRLTPYGLVLLAALVVLAPVTIGLGARANAFVGGFGLGALPAWLELALAFAIAFGVMLTIADGVARTFARFAPLAAYRLDIVGSLLGIVAFSALAFLGTPPVAWALVIAIALLVLLGAERSPARVLAVCGFVVLAGFQTFTSNDIWSPYNRITVTTERGGRLEVQANGFPHMSMATLGQLRSSGGYYFIPYAHASSVGEVLLIGAGAGNDAAAALASSATHVDAVEIDPELYDLGRTRNPVRPYDDPRVTGHIEDGRAFLQATDERWNVIVFAFPQSVALLSGQSSVRLESYLLTEQALQEARDHLAPGGTFSLLKSYRRDVIGAYAAMIARVFGRAPCLQTVGAGSTERAALTVGPAMPASGCEPLPAAPSGASVTDDHPFPYLLGRTIPSLYVYALAAILLFSLLSVRVAAGPLRPLARYADLFLMGVAFLLLETSNVVRFALLFGTTWLVNALVFFGILVSVYLAIEVASRVAIRPAVLYVVLLASVAGAWLIPPESLLALPPAWRFVAATATAFAPVFLANLVFAERFRNATDSTSAFGANLLGAILGGVLEYLALVTGYRALLLVVGAAYLGAFAATEAMSPDRAQSADRTVS